ncbi:prostaglandin D2 receptor 2 [Carlito syrichta]|uniref:Prostaglandin D2 receptor 2 n=1 Tax=Carlito syrichta TaxID=1868482 RepID=A0A1U7SQ37_CARSF|nr:prostaglandin D2 receptor 2 [Carlito syrichta]
MAANATLKPLCPVLEQMSRLQGHGNSSARYMDHAAVLLHGLAALLGLAENGLILLVVGCRMRQTVVTAWVLHLALSDLLASASLPFFTYFLAAGHSWELGTAFCKVHSSVFFLNMFASGFLLSAISLDRCVQVLRPVWAQNHRSVAAAHRKRVDRRFSFFGAHRSPGELVNVRPDSGGRARASNKLPGCESLPPGRRPHSELHRLRP